MVSIPEQCHEDAHLRGLWGRLPHRPARPLDATLGIIRINVPFSDASDTTNSIALNNITQSP